MFDLADYSYELPRELIAQVPAARRDASRLMVVDREGRSFSEAFFSELPRFFRPGDLLVVNDTRVVPAKIFGRKPTGGRVEILVLEHRPDPEGRSAARTCLMRSSKGARVGGRLIFAEDLVGEIQEVREDGLVKINFTGERPVDSFLEETGSVPLPPYIRRGKGNGHSDLDRERYQTLFAREKGAVAAPTAGLHFTREVMDALGRAGVHMAALTLHVGYATFRPVRAGDIRDHRVGEEVFKIGAATAALVNRTRQQGGRVIAVGTTVVRALESGVTQTGRLRAAEARTDLVITPGYRFRMVDGLITNFHLPKSSLLFLVCAFGGRELIREAYGLAVSRKYRFYSYGDAMLIL